MTKLMELTAEECKKRRIRYLIVTLILMFIVIVILFTSLFFGSEVNLPAFIFLVGFTVFFAQEVNHWVIMEKLSSK